ncbi:MAG: sn-glycerol-3-phosphate ABC transporter ATP-binding protein UgpC [Firmicutes bacterium]|nr:sn-glycerol-3-phosphate ABC transporter ATP-binding protein UgpC [Bacillota bacterium]
MSGVKLKGIKKVYGGKVTAVHDFNINIKDKEFIVLVGPSGCGKTTTLRMIAGLEEITEGELLIDDKLVNDVPPKNRDIAMVFQNYALYPHMTVFENMAFGLKLRKFPKDEINQKVHDTAKILEIEDLLNRKPKELSGGQRQRVALGRAIVRNPKVFLMDEPLSNLDAKLRIQMRTEISKLHKRLQTTFIYVTHDQTEAMTMGTRIVVMKDGYIQQIDTPQNTYKNPNNLFVASFIGSPQINVLTGIVIVDNDKAFVRLPDNTMIKLQDRQRAILEENNYINKEVYLGIRPEHLNLVEDDSQDEFVSIIESKVEVRELMGAETYIYLSICDNQVIARVKSALDKEVDEKIELQINAEDIHLFDKDTENTIF